LPLIERSQIYSNLALACIYKRITTDRIEQGKHQSIALIVPRPISQAAIAAIAPLSIAAGNIVWQVVVRQPVAFHPIAISSGFPK
jgi:hypothetical protein